MDDKGHTLNKKPEQVMSHPPKKIAKQCIKLKIPEQTTWNTKLFDLIPKLPY
jgi:hypothetical protein